MVTRGDNYRMAMEMNQMLLEDDEQYLKDLETRISRTTMCIRCGLPIEGATVNQLRHARCAHAHTKEQVKLKKLSEALTKVNDSGLIEA